MRIIFFKNFPPLRGLIFLCLLSVTVFAQKNSELALGDEYFQNKEFDKAKAVYEQLAKKGKQPLQSFYSNYLKTEFALKDLTGAEKLIKRAVKTYPQEASYKIDLADLYQKQDKTEESQKIIEKVIKENSSTQQATENLGDYLLKNDKSTIAKQLFIEARKKQGIRAAYAAQLAAIYKFEGNTESMLDELLNTIDNGNSIDRVKSELQNLAESPEDLTKLRKVILRKLQAEPDNISYGQLLVWAYVQEKDFFGAFTQSKAIDKRFKLQGQEVLDLGRIALENKDYENAVLCYDYVAKEYKNVYAKRLMINAKEEMVKNTIPVDNLKLRELIRDYESVCSQEGNSGNCLEAKRSQALIYGFYLEKLDTAEVLLNQVIKQGRFDQNLVDKSKINLADLYILKNEPWESTLLYMQVERTQVETTIGHEAKFKDAKLHFYQNEFQLAQDQLDVLKLATSREISNDAIELSLLIQDNLAADSTGMPLRNYAEVELLVFRNKQTEALEKLQLMEVRYRSNKIIMPQILLTTADIYRKSGNFDKAYEKLGVLISSYPQAVTADEAAYNQAFIAEVNLKNKEKALELYQNFLKNYPSSIYTVEARKRFRLLRGDKIN